MVTRLKVKESFEVETKYGAFYTGRSIEWAGDQLICQNRSTTQLFDISQGRVVGSLTSEGAEDIITTLTATPDPETRLIVSSHRSGLLHLWSRQSQTLIKTWKSVHKGPIATMTISSDSSWLATGGSDSCVRLWDLETFNCVHNLRGCQGVISVVRFNPDSQELFAAGDDYAIRCWQVGQNSPRLTLNAHYSRVTALVFHPESQQLFSCGRDSVVCIWGLASGNLVRTVPVYEGLEAMVLLPVSCQLPGGLRITKKSGVHVATAGEKGVIRVWQIEKAKEVFTQSNSQISASSEPGGLAITNLLLNKEGTTLAVTSVDHNIVFHTLDTFNCERLLAGNCDEILDVVLLGPNESHIALASNSPDIKLYRARDMHCQLLRGHTDLVLTLASSHAAPCLLASAAKDNTIRVWLLDPDTSSAVCVAVGERHTASVGALALSQLSPDWLISAAQDECLKAWKLPSGITDAKKVEGTPVPLQTKFSEIAHNKEINSVCTSPNDQLLVTTSQDKTAKLWMLEGLQLQGVLRGHRRGVWCARFSPTDQVLATGSADCTVRMWSISDLSCVKTLEVSDSSVLRLEFLSGGTQLLTAGGDGALQLWNVKNGESTVTLDAHEGRIWALAVSSDEKRLMSGGSDSTLVTWRDVTMERQEEARKTNEQLVLGEQRLSNLLKVKDFSAALEAAVALNRPRAALDSIQGLMQDKSGKTVTAAIERLGPDLQTKLMQYALTWNTNTRSYLPAQMVLNYVLTSNSVPMSDTDVAQALAYTDKHMKRLSQLRADLHFLKYMAERMSLLPSTDS